MMIRIPYGRIHSMRYLMIRGSIVVVVVVVVDGEKNNNNDDDSFHTHTFLK